MPRRGDVRGEGEKRGAPIANTNSVGNLGKRRISDEERAARLEADRLLNLHTPDAVRILVSMMLGKDITTGAKIKSTNYDKQHAAVAILDRKIPKITQADIDLHGMPAVTVRIPGLNWPTMDGGDPIAVEVEGPREAVIKAIREGEDA